jgi:hypothetical protein
MKARAERHRNYPGVIETGVEKRKEEAHEIQRDKV